MKAYYQYNHSIPHLHKGFSVQFSVLFNKALLLLDINDSTSEKHRDLCTVSNQNKHIFLTGTSSKYLLMSNLVSWGSYIYSVGGIVNSSPFLGSKIFNPSSTGSGLWQEIMNGSLIGSSRYDFLTLLVPASIIPNLPPGCVGLQKSNLTTPHLKQKLDYNKF